MLKKCDKMKNNVNIAPRHEKNFLGVLYLGDLPRL